MGLIRRWLEKALGRWEEGPDAPERVQEEVERFAAAFPRATRHDWARFAADHARAAYRQGYRRGYEHVERVPSSWLPDVPPELLADQVDPTWRERAIVLGDPGIIVPEALPEADAIRGDLDRALEAAIDASKRDFTP